MKEGLYGPVEALLEGGSDDTWAAIRKLLHQVTEKAVSEFSFALSGFEMDDEEKEDMILKLKNYARGVVEGKTKEESAKVLYRMKERYCILVCFVQRNWNSGFHSMSCLVAKRILLESFKFHV